MKTKSYEVIVKTRLLKAFNSKKLSIAGPYIRKCFNIPTLGGRSNEILWALDYLHKNFTRNRISSIQNICEFGVSAGEGFRQLILLADAYASEKKIAPFVYHGFDTFDGMPPPSDKSDTGSWQTGDFPGDAVILRNVLNKICEGRYFLYEGMFDQTIQYFEQTPSLILIDCDYYTSTKSAIVPILDRLQPGCIFYFDDLGTNFYNPAMGEERFIAELNEGKFGENYYLQQMTEKCFVFSNSEKPIDFTGSEDVQRIPLQKSMKLPRQLF